MPLAQRAEGSDEREEDHEDLALLQLRLAAEVLLEQRLEPEQNLRLSGVGLDLLLGVGARRRPDLRQHVGGGR